MQKNVTSSQIFSLYNLYIFTTVIAFLLGILLEAAGYSTPVGMIVGSFAGLLLVYPAYKTASLRPNEFIVQYGSELVGRLPHLLFILMIIGAQLLLAAVNLRQLSDFLQSVYLIGTPQWALVAIFGICVAYAVHCGLETIFRIAQGIFLISAIAFFIIPFLATQEAKSDMLIALITHLSLEDVGSGSYLMAIMVGELSFLFLVFPYLKSPKKVYRTFLATILSSLVIIFSHAIPVLLAFGPELGGNLTYPDMELIRFIRVGSFIETLDPILIILWLTSIFVKISFIIYTSVHGISQLTGVKDHRPFSIPATAYAAVFSITLARSHIELLRFLLEGLAPVLILTEFFIPWIYWIAGTIRGSKRNEESADSESAD
ncbi:MULTISPECIES: endospore germination permease [Paenibacillus]|uniref:GerAB/ArcD/ProY family transporter n=1 Tax=Paenibacillus TaxID=44249 RepID=UPI002FE012AF